MARAEHTGSELDRIRSGRASVGCRSRCASTTATATRAGHGRASAADDGSAATCTATSGWSSYSMDVRGAGPATTSAGRAIASATASAACTPGRSSRPWSSRPRYRVERAGTAPPDGGACPRPASAPISGPNGADGARRSPARGRRRDRRRRPPTPRQRAELARTSGPPARSPTSIGVTGVQTPAAMALHLGKGVCQDYAHILLAVLRLLGIPARYVSGHLLGEGAPHAWVEALVEDASALGVPRSSPTIRPTVAARASNYITVAVGRDYADVAPTSGTFSGPATGRLSAEQAGRRRRRSDYLGRRGSTDGGGRVTVAAGRRRHADQRAERRRRLPRLRPGRRSGTRCSPGRAQVRPHYAALARQLATLGPADVARRQQAADLLVPGARHHLRRQPGRRRASRRSCRSTWCRA